MRVNKKSATFFTFIFSSIEALARTARFGVSPCDRAFHSLDHAAETNLFYFSVRRRGYSFAPGAHQEFVNFNVANWFRTFSGAPILFCNSKNFVSVCFFTSEQ